MQKSSRGKERECRGRTSGGGSIFAHVFFLAPCGSSLCPPEAESPLSLWLQTILQNIINLHKLTIIKHKAFENHHSRDEN